MTVGCYVQLGSRLGCAMSPTPPLPVTEDTPPDMLAGSMDLQVVLPSGKSVKMSVERSTPMMDLLVQVTTAHKIAPGSHVLQALGDRGVLPYKPSTPIGTLDTWTIQVVPKSRLGSTASKKAPLKPSNQQPFEQTFRLQVHLPRNQLFVTRTSAKIALSDILCQVCAEKNLDPTKYELRHPGNLDEVLELGCSLADYKLQEVVLAAKSSRPLSASLSSTDIMVLHREEEKRRQQAKSGSSSSTSSRFFGVFKRNRSSTGEGSVSSDSLGGRSVSPARSDESISRSASPPAPSLPPTMEPPPSRPQRKRRPAPAPPTGNNKLAQQDTRAKQGSSNKDDGKGEKGTLMSHSRNSSDSSGYHEASVLSESPDSHSGPQTFDSSSAVDSLPRRSKLTQATSMSDHSHALSRSLSSLAATAHDARPPAKPSMLSASTTALSSAGQVARKKRTAPPPPKPLAAKSVPDVVTEDKLKTTSLDRHLRDKDAAVLEKSSSLPTKVKLSKQEGSVSSFDSASKASLRSVSSTEEEEIFEPEEEDPPSLQTPVPPPRSPSPQLAPVVEPPVASCPDPVEARPDVELESTEGGKIVESQRETKTVEVPEISVPQPLEQVQLETIIPQAVESLPVSGMTLSDPVVPPPPEDGKIDSLDIDWEYQLPAPPSAFRDCASPSIMEGETVPLEDARVFQETEGSVDSGDFSLTDVAEHPKVRKSLDDFSVHISGGEITRINPLFDPHQFESSLEEATQSSFAVPEPSLAKADHNWSSKSNEDMFSRKLSEAVDHKELTDGKQRSHSVDVADAFQPHHLSNFKISTYQGRRDIDSIFREAEAESTAVKKQEFKEPLPVLKHAHQYGSTNSLEVPAATAVKGNIESREEVDAKLMPTVTRSASHIFLAGLDKSYVGKPRQLESGRTPSLESLAGELPVAKSRVEDLRRRSSSSSHEKLMLKARSELNLHQGGSDVLKDDPVLNPVSQKTVLEQKKEIPLQSLQVLRTILPHMMQNKVEEELKSTSSTNQSSEPSGVRGSGAELVSESSVSDSKPQSSGSEKRDVAVEESSEKRYRYQGPPAIKLSSWNERPKMKVDIKQDSDYRVSKEKTSKAKTEEAESQSKEITSSRVANVGTVEPTKVEQTPLTMRLVSNAPARKGLSTSQILESISRPEPPFEFIPPTKEPMRTSVHVGKIHSDPSRIPIVRAVELKKPFQQQLQSGSGVSISIVRQDEEVLVGGERVDGQVNNGFAGVNSLARMFSSGTLKPYKNTRPLSAYEYGSSITSSEKPSDSGSIYIDGARKPEDFANSLVRSSSVTNLSTPSITTNSCESGAPKKYTSIVGINKSGSSVQFASGSSVVKVNGFSSSRQLAPVVKGFRLASQPASSVSVRIEHQTPTEANGLHARVQRSESAFVKSSHFSARDQPPAIVKVHEKPVPSKSSLVKTQSLPGSEGSESMPPPPPPFLTDVVLKKVDRLQPKNSASMPGDIKGQLMEAIRNHGGRDTLKKTQRTEANMPNVILRV